MTDPTDEDLRAFARSLIEDTGDPVHELGGLELAIREHRGLWVKLYRVSAALEGVEEPIEH